MQTVLVTGGLGRSGQWLVDRLAGDYDVVCVDYDHPGFETSARDHVDFRAADLTERGETLDLLFELDPDAVVHWAAIPAPTRHPGGRVFETNLLAAYNVLVGAGRAGARTVWASSESAYGWAFAREKTLPDELPITESHPMRPEDPYGASKVAGEEVAQMVERRYDVPVTSIRPSWIQYPGEYTCRDVAAEGLDGGAGNFWSYVDVRDVASLVASAVESEHRGHEAVHAAAADTYLGRPTAVAVEDFFGGLPDTCTLEDEESALSTAKAERLFGWRPAHTWRDAADEAVAEPSLVLTE